MRGTAKAVTRKRKSIAAVATLGACNVKTVRWIPVVIDLVIGDFCNADDLDYKTVTVPRTGRE